ncbi:MAG: DNA polymerase I [Burkholderiales bacterium]|nr:DNA polymerase I [Burkholderiales bacterium]OUT78017.1 MAG: DNA polymerase I [Betaproteobacteria bacterium TMED22]
MKRLLLIDGSSYLYRAFHAMPDFRNKADEPTGAIYGVINMLKRARYDIKPDYVACIFDAKGKTFRDEIYPKYKANRPRMPEDLRAQIEPLHECIEALGVPLLVIPDVEADDVIATLTKKGLEEKLEIVISTGDKDIAQLIKANVTIINTMTGENLDTEGVKAKFGVYPGRMVDYQSLVGDSVDNVPGVDKVGPKTAVKWLNEYGDLDSIIANADQIKGKVGENLRLAVEWLPTTRELVTLKENVAINVRMENLKYRPEDKKTVARLFEKLNFRTWLDELHKEKTEDIESKAATTEQNVPQDYQLITSLEKLEDWIKKISIAKLTAIDTETTGLDSMQAKLVGISLATKAGQAGYIPVGHDYADCPEQLDVNLVLEKLKPWLEDQNQQKVGQNLKFDLHIFNNHGIRMRGIAHDTLLQSYVLESHRKHDMDSLAQRHLGLKTTSYDEITGKGINRISFSKVDLNVARDYAAEDADITLRLHGYMWPLLEREPKLTYIYRDIELPAMEILFEIERFGVLVDAASLDEQTIDLSERIQVIEKEAFEEAGSNFNLSSPKQLQEILFNQKQLPILKKTPGGKPSTNEEVLQQLALDHPLPALILNHRTLSKLKTTYTEKLPRMLNEYTGRIHTNYAQAVANTGRLASNEPNLQNIPIRTEEGRRVREAFIAPAGSVIVSADYSQIELRIMAHLSEDESLIKAFKNGEDVHRQTASEIFNVTPIEVSTEQRRYAKVINFGLIYGMSAFGLAKQLGVERSAAQQYIDRYFSRYPGVANYMDRSKSQAKELGYVETVFGRRLTLPEIHASNHQMRQAAERAAINAPMQGTAADLIKIAMISVNHWLRDERLKTNIIMQVHDELILEVPKEELELILRDVPQRMASIAQLSVPLVADIGSGKNWEQAH